MRERGKSRRKCPEVGDHSYLSLLRGGQGGLVECSGDKRLTFPSGRSQGHLLLSPGIKQWELGGYCPSMLPGGPAPKAYSCSHKSARAVGIPRGETL